MKTVNFLYWLHNFRSDDFPKIFDMLGHKEHLQSKLIQHYNEANGSVLGIVRFIMDLSNDNKLKLVKWVDTHYDCGFDLKTDSLQEVMFHSDAYTNLYNYVKKAQSPELHLLFLEYLRELKKNIDEIEDKTNSNLITP